MKETTIYQFIKTLQKKGVWNGIAGSCSYWATRADYLTIYEYVQTNFPTHPYGYLVKTANALSNKRLGGGYYWLDKENIKYALRTMEEKIFV